MGRQNKSLCKFVCCRCSKCECICLKNESKAPFEHRFCPSSSYLSVFPPFQYLQMCKKKNPLLGYISDVLLGCGVLDRVSRNNQGISANIIRYVLGSACCSERVVTWCKYTGISFQCIFLWMQKHAWTLLLQSRFQGYFIPDIHFSAGPEERFVLIISFQCGRPKKAYFDHLFFNGLNWKMWTLNLNFGALFFRRISQRYHLLVSVRQQHKCLCFVFRSPGMEAIFIWDVHFSKSGHNWLFEYTANECLFKLKVCGPAPCLSWQITDLN